MRHSCWNSSRRMARLRPAKYELHKGGFCDKAAVEYKTFQGETGN
jgi:hypothetical protein